MKKQDKDAYWNTVLECLLVFHNIDKTTAKIKTDDLRTKLAKNDTVYHAEPFHVACDMNGKQLDLTAHRNEYMTIMNKYGW